MGQKRQINKQIAISPIREEMNVVSHGDQLNQVSESVLDLNESISFLNFSMVLVTIPE